MGAAAGLHPASPGLAPAAISFAAGQAAFTLTLMIFFNIIAPVGYRIGIIRIEDIASAARSAWWSGCCSGRAARRRRWAGRSPRRTRARGGYLGAGRALRGAPLRARRARRCPGRSPSPPRPPPRRGGSTTRSGSTWPSAAASGPTWPGHHPGHRRRRARLAADAVLELWEREDGAQAATAPRPGASSGHDADVVAGWYARLGEALRRRGAGARRRPSRDDRGRRAAGRRGPPRPRDRTGHGEPDRGADDLDRRPPRRRAPAAAPLLGPAAASAARPRPPRVSA